MHNTSMILSSLFFMALVIMIAPSVVAINRGKMLRNIALWLTIVLGLALIYQHFGPSSAMPLFSLNSSITREAPGSEDSKARPSTDGDRSDDGSEKGDQGYVPPKE